MGILKLRNCTQWTLKYWREIAFHNTNYVAPGEEGTYSWKATYTLKAERSFKPEGTGMNRAVNQNGTYYAVWNGEKILILDEKQIHGWRPTNDNPYIAKWVKTETASFAVDWINIFSRVNTSDVTLELEHTYNTGFANTTTHTISVTESNTIGVAIGAAVEVKGVDISGEITNESSTETFREHMNETQIFGNETHNLKYTLEPHHSLVIWQAYSDVLGNKLFLDHVVFATEGDPKPSNIRFTQFSVAYAKL